MFHSKRKVKYSQDEGSLNMYMCKLLNCKLSNRYDRFGVSDVLLVLFSQTKIISTFSDIYIDKYLV